MHINNIISVALPFAVVAARCKESVVASVPVLSSPSEVGMSISVTSGGILVVVTGATSWHCYLENA